MKQQIQGTEKKVAPRAKSRGVPVGNGPSLYELEYLNQIVSELKEFLDSRSVTTLKNIYVGFQGDEYSGQMLLSKGA